MKRTSRTQSGIERASLDSGQCWQTVKTHNTKMLTGYSASFQLARPLSLALFKLWLLNLWTLFDSDRHFSLCRSSTRSATSSFDAIQCHPTLDFFKAQTLASRPHPLHHLHLLALPKRQTAVHKLIQRYELDLRHRPLLPQTEPKSRSWHLRAWLCSCPGGQELEMRCRGPTFSVL